MEHQSEPCASIPKTHLTVDLVWCHHHQAWTLTVSAYREDADLTLDDDRCTVVHFGPFDGPSDVHAVVAQWLADGLAASAGN